MRRPRRFGPLPSARARNRSRRLTVKTRIAARRPTVKTRIVARRPTVKTRIVARSGLASALLRGVSVADAQADTEAEQESPADGERDKEGGQRCVDPLRDQLIVKLLPALTAPPANGGMCAARNLPAMHPPTGVPGKGPWSTTAEETEPFGANVMVT